MDGLLDLRPVLDTGSPATGQMDGKASCIPFVIADLIRNLMVNKGLSLGDSASSAE